ncbi:DUF4365 domain-containing protein [Chryseobacterium sp.]|uniref:DUF4365 domain-containing protein n=1 Tax=Chryseobacterium sp. TaxID=1871047 RepID=UPI000EBFAB28|nr:DUF4365 domain-containing protein [Chryseobacterium sp.]HCA06795.1 hypothetical protein [Chryseobacterium sp.]
MKHKIDELNLPKDSRNNQLETISKNHFRPLFDVEKFVVKEEVIDNGIDFRFEIKKNNSILGFGFNFQLKSTESTQKNQDGSYSKSIETTNIEYLLNNGQPGFYGFYIEDEKTIYYTDLKKVISNLTEKDPNWQDQPNHTIRFIEKLNSDSINEIYNTAFQNGQMLRKINCALAENFSHIEKYNKIIVDFNNNVITDSEIIAFIENNGLSLTDKCRWDEVINLHQKSTVSSNKTPKYNLVLGISYYYSGEYFRALDFFKEAYKKIDLLDSSLQEYLLYFYYGLQRILNIISEEDYEKITNSFEENSIMYLYKQLETAKNLMGEMYNSEDYVSIKFEEKINEILSNPNTSKYIRVLANIERVYYKSEQLISKLIPLIEFGYLDIVESEFFAINNEYDSVLNETRAINSVFINHFCSIRHSRFVVHFDCIVRRRKKSDFLDKVLPEILKNIEASYLYFKEINHVENELYTLAVLLEHYQNLENEEKVSEVNTLLDRYKIEYANQDFNRRIDFTKNGGTFTSFIITAKEKIDKNIAEIEKIRAELIELDKIEKESDISYYENANTIELFPMRHFQFPENETDLFFKILKIEDKKLQEQLKKMFTTVIPVINCFQDEIKKEGYLDGNFEYKGIESYRNIYRIRKEMFDNKFYRRELKFGRNL